jgi:molecular chaperone GrpE
MTAPDDMGNGPVIRDHRRIDPVTGQVRRGKHAASQPAGTSSASRSGGTGPVGGRHGRRADGSGDTPDEVMDTEEETHTVEATPATSNLEIELGERTADLQRLQAEYQNYRKRVERDRVAVKEAAIAAVLSELLPVLDAIGQARDHGELSGGFKSVADSLQATVHKLGLVTYGEKGDVFDPKVHEALTHMYSPDVTEVTCAGILQPGYKVGERILRPARVAVAEPTGDTEDSDA